VPVGKDSYAGRGAQALGCAKAAGLERPTAEKQADRRLAGA